MSLAHISRRLGIVLFVLTDKKFPAQMPAKMPYLVDRDISSGPHLLGSLPFPERASEGVSPGSLEFS